VPAPGQRSAIGWPSLDHCAPAASTIPTSVSSHVTVNHKSQPAARELLELLEHRVSGSSSCEGSPLTMVGAAGRRAQIIPEPPGGPLEIVGHLRLGDMRRGERPPSARADRGRARRRPVRLES